MKNVRWRIILVVVVLFIALFKIYPTVKWATLTPERKTELKEQWEEENEKQKESREWALLSPAVRGKQAKELKAQGKPVPSMPSLFRNIRVGLKKWWLGDEEQVLPLGLDLKGGIRVELKLDKKDKEYIEPVFDKLMRRIDQFGVREPDIRRVGDLGISIELPGATNIERVRRLIEEQAFMQWVLVEEELMQKPAYTPKKLQSMYDNVVRELEDQYEGDVDEYGNPIQWSFKELDEKLHVSDIPESVILRIWDDKNPATGEVIKRPLLLRSSPDNPEIVRGDELKPDKITRSTDDKMRPIINFKMISSATDKFARITTEYNEGTDNAIPESIDSKRGWRIAILIDNKVITAPSIRTQILTGSGTITGLDSVAEADNQVIQLRSGSLPVKPTIISIIQVGPRLGADSIRMGVRAALLGLMLVILFMLIYYLKSGAIAVFALCLNILIILAALATLGATLTLPGIAGIILTIGMAVDANVLIFERIREEFSAAKKIKAAITSGYEKAFRTILDANLTTLITALILYRFGTGPLKGFAVTLSFGILASMFTALFVTRLVFELLLRIKSFDSLKMLKFFSQPKIDFANLAKKALVISGIVIAIGIASFASRFDQMLGIDFRGGFELRMVFAENVDVSEVRNIVQKDLGYNTAQVRLFDKEGDNTNKISVQSNDKIEEDVPDVLVQKLGVQIEPNGISRTEVGPAHAATMWEKAIIAIVLSLAGIIIYVWFRFEFIFGIAAVIALIHDVLITLGIFSGMFFLGARQINLPIIAAILTIIGYSLNDTIVVFDRIREDLKIMKRLTFKQIVNTSINQTLSRTILTSVTTLLVILSLLVLGGQAVGDFAFAMFAGVIVGTYSSIFIASPVLLLFYRKRA